MEFTIQIKMKDPESGNQILENICLLNKEYQQLEDIGLSLAESKIILQHLQEKVVSMQINKFLESKKCCESCKKKYRKKGSYPMTYRTLFGDLSLSSPRLYTCNCDAKSTQKTFSPLPELITEKTAPERLFIETKWASLMPFEKTVDLLKDVLPVSDKLNASSIRNHLLKLAKREEKELGEEQFSFIEGNQRQWESLSKPEGTIVVGLDGGYLQKWKKKGKKFEVIAGKSLPNNKKDKYFAFVDTYQNAKPKRRLYEVLKSQGMQANQSIEFLSDGAANLHELQECISPLSEHYLDWFHITMRITVLHQYLKGMVKVDKQTAETYQSYLQKTKWYLWHGNTIKTMVYLDFFNDASLIDNTYEHLAGFKKKVIDFVKYIKNNKNYLTNYGERYRNNEIYTSSFTEASVNEVIARRFSKKQQMQWTKEGAHYMLQTRAKVLNSDWRDCFKKWYPNFNVESKDKNIQKVA